MPQSGDHEDQLWPRRYALMLLFNVILIILFAVIGHFFNR